MSQDYTKDVAAAQAALAAGKLVRVDGDDVAMLKVVAVAEKTVTVRRFPRGRATDEEMVITPDLYFIIYDRLS